MAYLTATRLVESRRALTADYRPRASDIVLATTLAPEYAPLWSRELTVWDKLESYEDEYALKRYKTEASQTWYRENARTAKTIVVALPKELTPSDWKELVCEFAQERFVSRGLIVTLAIHNDEGNPHAHLQISRRSLNEAGEWSWAKDRDITTKAALIETRRLWAEKVNHYLEREGFTERVTHQSYLDLGLSFEATKHEGWFARRLHREGKSSRILAENQSIQARNQERSAIEPQAILQELTTHQATFSALDVAKKIQTRVLDDAPLARAVYETTLSQAILVGSHLDGHARYTSPVYADKEEQALGWVEVLQHQKPALSIDPIEVETLLHTTYEYLNAEQKSAVKVLCQDNGFGVLIGRAGTGKTTTLKAVVECHQKAGYQVIGLALSAVAAENLSVEADLKTETIAFYLDKWTRLEDLQKTGWTLDSDEHRFLMKSLSHLQPYQLTDKHLVLVDEAGMVGTAQWHRLLYFAQKTSAKLIAIGDDHQFKAIEAGDLFRKLKELTGQSVSLQNIQRQRSEWMRQASVSLAELKTYEALATYENQGCVQKIETLTTLAERYVNKCLQEKDRSGLLLTSTNAQCDLLNQAIRTRLKKLKIIAREETTFNGASFSRNDEIVFLANDRLGKIKTYNPMTQKPHSFLVKNGTPGRLLSIEPYVVPIDGKEVTQFKVTVELSSCLHAEFWVHDYANFKHRYAMTLHKAQGQTVDWSYVLASPNMDAFATYVALTRHRTETCLFYEAQAFSDFKSLQRSLGRLSYKDLKIDYTISAEHQDAWEAVQEYKLLGQDLIATVQETQWESYHALKQERETLGQHILSDWVSHQPFAEQAGLTFESIAIQCGLKARPLSLAERSAQETVHLYGEKASAARSLWVSIRSTHPGKSCYQHERYAEFTTLRQERNALARRMLEHPGLYKPFVRDLNQGGWKALTAQAKQPDTFKVYEQQHTPEVQKSEFTRITPAEIKLELQHQISVLAKALLGEPNRRTAREWRYGSHGSVSIHVHGARQGLYADFERGSFGGPLKLIEDRLQLNYKEAYKWAIQWLGHPERPTRDRVPSYPKAREKMPWVPLYPVPLDKANPILSTEKSLQYILKQSVSEVARYAYLDAQGHLLGYTVRLEDAQGHKMVLPLTYCQNTQHEQQWRWQGFGEDRPLYGLNRLAEHPDKPVLLVEGEKTAEAAQRLFPETVAITWPGGAGAVSKVDWSPLMGKAIVLWPDNDEPGHRAMDRIEHQLSQLHEAKSLHAHIERVSLPEGTPAQWDLADELPNGWTLETLKSLLPMSVREFTKTLTPEYVKAVTRQYGIAEKEFRLDGYFIHQAKQVYENMLDWHAILETPVSPQQHEALLEKAVLTQVVWGVAKREYCYGESHLSAQNRSEALALMTASLLQKHRDKKLDLVTWVDTAYNALTQQQKSSEDLIKAYQETYPHASLPQLQLMAEQRHLCQNHVNLSLNEVAQHKILDAAKRFEALQHTGEIAKAIHTVVQQQKTCSIKETDQTVALILERQCMKQMLMHPEKPAEHLPTAIKLTKETQIELEHRLQELTRGFERSKEKERER